MSHTDAAIAPTSQPTVLPTPLVSTQWLADNLSTAGLVVIDATVLATKDRKGAHRWLSGLDQYLIDGHIAGAVFADVLETFSDAEKPHGFARPSAEQFVAAAASVGIDDNSTVVIYDDSVGLWAARIWWLLRSFGFENAAVLDGGLPKWRAEERAIEFGYVEPADAGVFTAVDRPELWVQKHHVEAVVDGTTEATLVCAAPRAEFTGEAGSRARLGHIPGSVSLPAGRLVDRADNAILVGDALNETLAPALTGSVANAAAGVAAQLDRQIITYCSGGVAAAAAALALTAAGATNVAIYDGSLNEWVADENAPLVSLV